jgi:hypothetical protein
VEPKVNFAEPQKQKRPPTYAQRREGTGKVQGRYREDQQKRPPTYAQRREGTGKVQGRYREDQQKRPPTYAQRRDAKSELEGAREVPMEEAAAFAASAGMGYAEASARTGQGVQETFATLVEGARMRYDDYRANPPPRPPPQAADAAGTSGESFPDPP